MIPPGAAKASAAPKEDPKIVIATVIENVGSGSKFAAPISNKIINFYLDNKLEKY